MKVLVVLAHGSRIAKSNQEAVTLADNLKKKLGARYDEVVPCFLELTEPKFDKVIQQLAEDSATELVIYPHFLAEGRHVRDDIPEIIEAFREQHPGVKVDMLDYLGLWDGLTEFIATKL
ncbi:CbiX/SirB N-terminal domain-containing protein [Litoribacillus peritrichatus]|uniref:CbiX/SirB N-terminal domain-containing protein n=1 Tax=Litoribacillus peritrichatus TaxID=718191 RepID=A0ABP7MZK0_9GAMM